MSFSLKKGWHPPGRDGKKESFRNDFKGINQVAGWMGKGKDPKAEERETHVSQPLSSLKDPSTFGPPPKHGQYHGAAAIPNATTPDTRGLGAPLPQETLHHQQQQQAAAYAHQQEEEQVERPPPGPFRPDTTGLSTAHLPKPPVRRLDSPSSSSSAAAPPKPAPRLPPRLPPRQNSHPDLHSPAPPPTYTEAAQYTAPNQDSLHRLGQSGVSVPGFNIGRTASPPKPPPRSPQPAGGTATPPAQLSELQSRFARMSSPSSASPATTAPAPAPSQGTTWAQKQAAVNTARSFHKDPSSLSLSDAKSAASTANNFRQRHGEQVAAGAQKASSMNQKYAISDRVGGFAGSVGLGGRTNRPTPTPPPPPSAASPGPSAAAAAGKKPPPPPPPKKRELGGTLPPPPVPLSSKPR